MSIAAKPKGQPLVALLAVLAGWAGGRLVTWDAPLLQQDAAMARSADMTTPLTGGYGYNGAAGPQSLPGFTPAAYQSAYAPADAFGFGAGATGALGGWPPVARWSGTPSRIVFAPAAVPRVVVASPPIGDWRLEPLRRHASGQDMAVYETLLAGGLDADLLQAAPRFLAPGALPDHDALASQTNGMARNAASPTSRHWSMDAWALLRGGGAGSVSPGLLPATYGGSQSGAVLRYRMSLASEYRPTAYLRTTSALGGVRDSAVALGIAARPLPVVPLVAAVEGRVVDQMAGRGIRPAALAYTELPPLALPGRLRGELYAQGGYVAGRFATPFVDGLVRVDRHLLTVGTAEARVGGGMWGGAQKGAARLDVGPSAAITMPLGKGLYGRLALDWRFQVAGNAVPKSGPAVTLSAGF